MTTSAPAASTAPTTPSITHSLAVIADIDTILTDVLQVALHGVGISAVKDVFQVLSALKAAIGDAKLALPELKELNADEVSQLTSAVYTMVQGVVKTVSGG